MEITKEISGEGVTMFLSGRLDSVAAAEFSKEIDAIGPDVSELVLDCGKLSYVSSAGLRIFLVAQKRMARRKGMKLRNVQGQVMEVFGMTGFEDLLDIEK